MMIWVWRSPCRSQSALSVTTPGTLVRAASSRAKAASVIEAIGLSTRMVKTPITTAEPAAGKMNRQADTPAALSATSSLRRLRFT